MSLQAFSSFAPTPLMRLRLSAPLARALVSSFGFEALAVASLEAGLETAFLAGAFCVVVLDLSAVVFFFAGVFIAGAFFVPSRSKEG